MRDSSTGRPEAGHDLLSRSGDCAVFRCVRGCLHLTIGEVTVRVDDETWPRLMAVCATAQAALQSSAADAIH